MPDIPDEWVEKGAAVLPLAQLRRDGYNGFAIVRVVLEAVLPDAWDDCFHSCIDEQGEAVLNLPTNPYRPRVGERGD